MGDNKHFSEVQHIISKIELIKRQLGDTESTINDLDTSQVKDKFEKIRIDLFKDFKEVETYVDKKIELTNSNTSSGPGVMERHKLQDKIDKGIDKINKNLKDLKVELDAQKKKKSKFPDIESKENLYQILNDRYILIKVSILSKGK